MVAVRRMAMAASVAVLLATTAPHANAAEPSAADVATARELFREGARAAQAGQWDRARQAYERSNALRPSALTRYSLALALMHTGRLVEALESYRSFLREPLDASTSQYRAAAEVAIQELEARVASIVVNAPSAPADVKIKLDGVVLRPAAIGVRRPLDPGVHQLEATAPGYEPFSQEFSVEPGTSAELSVELRRSARQEPLGLAAPEQAGGPGPRSASTAGIALLAAGGALLTGGIVVGLMGVAKAGDAPTQDGSEAKSARTFALVGDVMGGVGVAGLGVGTWLLLRPRPKADKPRAAAACSPWLSTTGAGVTLGGAF